MEDSIQSIEIDQSDSLNGSLLSYTRSPDLKSRTDNEEYIKKFQELEDLNCKYEQSAFETNIQNNWLKQTLKNKEKTIQELQNEKEFLINLVKSLGQNVSELANNGCIDISQLKYKTSPE